MTTSASTKETNTPATNAAPDPMEAALRQAAQSVDDGQEATDDAILEASGSKEAGKPAGGKAGTKPTPESNDQGADADPSEKSDDGKDKDKDGNPIGEKPEGQQPDSKEEKARKDAERLDKSWKGYQQKQTELKQQQAALEQRERQLAERETRLRAGDQARSQGPLKDKLGYTVAEYEAAAAQWEKSGNFESADLAKEQARKLREQERTMGERGNARGEQAQAQPPEHTPGTAEFTSTWKGHLAQLEGSEEYKDLKNKESELFKGTAALLHQEPRLSKFNDGIRIAAEIVKLRLAAGSASVLSKKLEEANKELDKLRKATSPGAGGGESRGAAAKPFEQMSDAEQVAHLKRQAAQVDD